jgi:predicted phosphoadenosine phosphosulfate sulfurtransferase
MKIYTDKNVMDAALDRIRFLFDEFPNVISGFSGGKDSTVCFNLCLQVAREKGRLPLKVMFLDQEAEWAATIEQVERVMTHPDVEPIWVQMPLRLFNAASSEEHWLHCWDPAAKDRWMHEQRPYAYTTNRYGTDRFGEVWERFLYVEFPNTPTCFISGVRCEESPTRFMALTGSRIYKHITWGKALNKKRGHYTFYPLYDWSYTDIWAAIHKNGWFYNSIYDAQYSYGLPVKDMRVSNVHHETAVHSLFHMQEIEPETYVKLTQRVAGADTAGKMGRDDYWVRDLPFMFADWGEYRDYLLEKLIDNPAWRSSMAATFKRHERLYGKDLYDEMIKVHISSILTHDWEQIKLANWEHQPRIYAIRQGKKKKLSWLHKK